MQASTVKQCLTRRRFPSRIKVLTAVGCEVFADSGGENGAEFCALLFAYAEYPMHGSFTLRVKTCHLPERVIAKNHVGGNLALLTTTFTAALVVAAPLSSVALAVRTCVPAVAGVQLRL